MRGALAALAACLVLPVLVVPGEVVAATGSPSTAIGPTGYYSAVYRVRALDGRVSGAIAAGATIKVRVTGLGHVPATGVVAISVNLTVLTPAVSGSLSAFADGTSWSGATMSFQAGQTGQNFETVPVSATGLIDLRNNTTRPLTLIVDVLGYHTSSAFGSYYGWYQPMTPTRLLDTRTGRSVAAGERRSFQVTGRAGIPPPPDYSSMAVVVNFTVLTPSRAGSLSVGTIGPDRTPTISFAAGQTEQDQLLMLLDGDGALSFLNNSAAAVQVIADVVGYYTGLGVVDPQLFYHFIVGGHDRVYDSRARGSAPVPPGGTVVLHIIDLELQDGILANSGISAPLLNITVLAPSTAGSISAWAVENPRDRAAAVSFAAHQTRQRMLLVAGGDIRIRNNSSAPITLVVDVDGWRTAV
jgi:hypothetical protein